MIRLNIVLTDFEDLSKSMKLGKSRSIINILEVVLSPWQMSEYFQILIKCKMQELPVTSKT